MLTTDLFVFINYLGFLYTYEIGNDTEVSVL